MAIAPAGGAAITAIGSAAVAGEIAITGAPCFARRKRRIKPRSVAILVFLTICALFFCVPLRVIVVTSFKTMPQIREGEIFALPTA